MGVPTSNNGSVELPEGTYRPCQGLCLLPAAYSSLATRGLCRSLRAGTSGQGQVELGTWVKKTDSVLLASWSDGCSELRWPAVSLRWDMVSSLCTVESEQMGGSDAKVPWGWERPSRPSMGISAAREVPLAAGSSSASSDSGISFEGDSIVVTGR